MKKKMTRISIVLQFAYLSLSWLLATVIVSLYFFSFFQISIIPYRILLILGILLILIGIPFNILTAFTVMPAYSADKLVIRGVYRKNKNLKNI